MNQPPSENTHHHKPNNPRILPDGRMTAVEAASYLGFEVGTLANWRAQKKGPRFIKLGGKVFYFKHDLDRHISESGYENFPPASA